MATLLYFVFVLGVIGLAVQANRDHGWRSGIPSLHLVLLAVPRGPESIEEPLLVGRALVAAVALLGLVPAALRHRTLLRPPIWMVAFFAVLVVAALVSVDGRAAIEPTFATILVTTIFFGFGRVIGTEDLRRALAHVTVLALVITVAAAFLDRGSFIEIPAPVLDLALVSSPLGFSAAQTAMIGLGGIAIAAQTTLTRFAGSVLGIVALAVTVLPMKRAFWLALVAGAVVWVVIERRRLLPPLLAVGAIVAVLFSVVQPLRDLWDPTPARPGASSFYSIRRGIFEAAIDRFLERPILGHGFGVGDIGLTLDVGQAGFLWEAHSELATALVSVGLAGTAVLAIGYVSLGRSAVGRLRDTGDRLPILAFAATVALLPFHQLLTDPSTLTLPLLLLVLPLTDRSSDDVGTVDLIDATD